MNPRVFRITQERGLGPTELGQLTDGSGPGWIDAGERNAERLRPLLEALGAHPLAIAACLDSVPASLVMPYGSSLLIALPLLSSWDSEERTHLWIVALPNTVVTIRDGKVPAVEHIIDRYVDGFRFLHPTTSAVVYQLLDHLIDEGLAATQSARVAVDAIESLVVAERFDDFAADSVALKRALTRLEGTFEEQLFCVSSLQAVDGASFSTAELREYFRDAFLHLEHALKTIGRQLAHLNALQQQSQLQLQERANSRLRLLTVMSTIFLPLTLVAGIYGMNFDRMPELRWANGYFWVLALMLLIAIGMLVQFHRKGWFD